MLNSLRERTSGEDILFSPHAAWQRKTKELSPGSGRIVGNSEVPLGRFLAESGIRVAKSAYDQLSRAEIAGDNIANSYLRLRLAQRTRSRWQAESVIWS